MDRQTKTNEFMLALEGLSTSINQMAFDVSSPLIDELVKSILDYIKKYPSIVCTKEEVKTAINKVYSKKHLNLKQNIDNNINSMKYNLEDLNVDINMVIAKELAKYKTMFMSISAGTNISYLGLVDECTQSIMALLIRKNASISFAKHIKQTEEDIFGLINENFLKIMLQLGDKLLDDGILPIENDFNLGKSKIKTEEF